MIQIQIHSNKVEKVLFIASTEKEEDLDLATWQSIRPFVDKIDKRLKSIVKDAGAREAPTLG